MRNQAMKVTRYMVKSWQKVAIRMVEEVEQGPDRIQSEFRREVVSATVLQSIRE